MDNRFSAIFNNLLAGKRLKCNVCNNRFDKDDTLVGIKYGKQVIVCKYCAKKIELKDQLQRIGLFGWLFLLISGFLFILIYTSSSWYNPYSKLNDFLSGQFTCVFAFVYFLLVMIAWSIFEYIYPLRFFLLPKGLIEKANKSEEISKLEFTLRVNKLSIGYGLYVLVSFFVLLYINFFIVYDLVFYIPTCIKPYFSPTYFWIEFITLVFIVPLVYIIYVNYVYHKHKNSPIVPDNEQLPDVEPCFNPQDLPIIQMTDPVTLSLFTEETFGGELKMMPITENTIEVDSVKLASLLIFDEETKKYMPDFTGSNAKNNIFEFLYNSFITQSFGLSFTYIIRMNDDICGLIKVTSPSHNIVTNNFDNWLIDYIVTPPYRGRKIMMSALPDIFKILEDRLGITDSIYAMVMPDNEASIHILESNRFVKVNSKFDLIDIRTGKKSLLYERFIIRMPSKWASLNFNQIPSEIMGTNI